MTSHKTGRFWPVLVILVIFVTSLSASTALQMRVVEGEGTTYATGSRATRGLTVLVTDESGKPVEGATVNFRLPDEGPGGSFTGGSRTQLVTTQADGRATVWGMQWNKTPGALEIRVTATKSQARAGLVSTQYLSDTAGPKSGGTGNFQTTHHTTRWLLVGAAVGAVAAAGIVYGKAEASKTSVVPLVQTTLSAPVITIGHP